MPDELAQLLLIESSGQVGHVGLAVGPDLIAERQLDATRRHARDLAPAVANLLRPNGWRASELGGVIVSIGPGSYTGLRVGIMSAKALAFASGCRVVGVPTFHAIARQATVPGTELEVVADARQDKLYVQGFARATTDDVSVPTSGLRIVPGRMWAEHRRSDLAVTGPGVQVAQRFLPTETPVAPAEQREPSLRGMLQVGWERFARGEHDPLFALEPIYLRPSSAEEQWQRLGR